MKGVELSEKYFEKFGMPMLEKDFAFLLPTLSAGLVGQGSECLFFDDDVSKDHDFEPGFCIFLSDADYEKYGFDLTRAYNKLPDEFSGFSRLKFSPAGRQSPRRFFVQRLLRKYYRQKFRAKNNFRLAENPAIRPTHRRIGQDVYK